MAAEPILYNLYWQQYAKWDGAPVALDMRGLLRVPNRDMVVILFPALLTPAVHARKDATEDLVDLLIYRRCEVEMPNVDMEYLVNHHLKVTRGLDPAKPERHGPLIQNAQDVISVREVSPDANGILRTRGGFSGILHRTVNLPMLPLPRVGPMPPAGKFYDVQVSLSCLEAAAERPLPSNPEREPLQIEYQDELIAEMLKRLNGENLRGELGFGTHCFEISNASVILAMVDMAQPIRAYHPLFVYPKGGLGHANIGHVSDVHVNARQQVLHQSDARVIDVDDDAVSPRIGSLINVYASNFLSILNGLKEKGADVVLLGGDLIDHVKNCYPWRAATRADAQVAGPQVVGSGETGNAGKIWKLVDLDDAGNYAANYQDFVDDVTVYSIVRHFCASQKTPVYAVTGNHDAYADAYGISPRPLAGLFRANPGIPADHNLTFYEALLVFGESYGTLKRTFSSNLAPALFEWFFNVFTPFSDYAVELPKQRIVGLHWGEEEDIVSAPFTGHGVGHLPRADTAATPAQVQVLWTGFRSEKPTVLSSHFTFVSYAERIPNRDLEGGQRQGAVATGQTSFESFGDHDHGTFEHQRQQLYRAAADSTRMQAVFTGHAHRRGLYLLEEAGRGGMGTQMHPIPVAPRPGWELTVGYTPIIVSDSAGPLPRLNYENEFGEWGSDRPSGTLLRVDAESGQPRSVVAVPATAINSKPRLAVALEYLHVTEAALSRTDAVFGPIETEPYLAGRALTESHAIRIHMGRAFDRIGYRIETIRLFCSTDGRTWNRLTLKVADDREGLIWTSTVGVAKVERTQNATFIEWLTAANTGKFVSVSFARSPGKTTPEALGRYSVTSPWNFEVTCTPVTDRRGSSDWIRYRIQPRFEAPDFEWRKHFEPYREEER